MPVANNGDVGSDSGFATDSDSDEAEDPSSLWPEIHAQVRSTIKELGGKVLPKLNWSAPKDATWISPTTDMECRTPNDIYLLLKSSDFITHDLEHAFDGCVPDQDKQDIPYALVLRKSFNLNPSLEFRCFVSNRSLVAISQREMNYFSFLSELQTQLKGCIQDFFQDHLLDSKYLAGDDMVSFVFDVYIPPPHDRVWLIDINPWATRTDPLLFSWLEILSMTNKCPISSLEPQEADREAKSPQDGAESAHGPIQFRLVGRDDPEAYQFRATKYSAHKLPADVVHASDQATGGSGMEDLMRQWKKVLDKQVEEDDNEDDD